MSLYLRLLMHAGSLSLMALVATGMPVCTEQDSLIQETAMDSDSVVQLTQCLMECTTLTFSRKVELGDSRNVRFTKSTEEEHRTPREYCWPVDLKCNVGESLQQAFVVVPVDASVVTHEHLEVNSTGPAAGTLSAHHGPATLADDCGLLYEVTPIYQSTATTTPESLFCVVILIRQTLAGDGMLKCPPFLVTFWQRSTDQPKQEGGG